MYYFVFNLPVYEGRDLTRLPLIERREIMRSVLKFSLPRIRISDYVEASATTCSTLFSSKDCKGWSGKEIYQARMVSIPLSLDIIRRTGLLLAMHEAGQAFAYELTILACGSPRLRRLLE
jgi:hypothetical protein